MENETTFDKTRCGIQAIVLKNHMAIINNFIIEAKIKLNKEGLQTTNIDPANVCMLDLKIPRNEFLLWDVFEDKEFCINLANLMNVLKDTKKDDICTLEVERTMLKIIIGNFNYTIPLIENDQRDQKMPSLEFKSRITGYDVKTLKDIFNNANKVSEKIVFTKKEFYAEGDISKFNFEIQEACYSGDESIAGYSLEYLNKYFKSNKINDMPTFRYGTDYPLMIEQGMIRFILAPKISTD